MRQQSHDYRRGTRLTLVGKREGRWASRRDNPAQVRRVEPEPIPLGRLNRIPSDAELEAIPLVEPTTLEITDRETVKLRRRLYALNRNNVAYRYRTMRENGLTLLWRLTR